MRAKLDDVGLVGALMILVGLVLLGGALYMVVIGAQFYLSP